MKKNDLPYASVNSDQLKKYARDLAELYASEKEKRKTLTVAKQQLEKYADDFAATYESLRNSEKRYRALFEYSPISLWEEDLSQIKNYVDDVRNNGVADFSIYFNDHPEEVLHCATLIKIMDVNKATVELYQADTKEELLGSWQSILGERVHEILTEEMVSIAEGRAFHIECVNRTLKGREITVMIQSTIPPGYEKTWEKVFVSVHDLTERARAEHLKKIFGRYLSEEILNTLIENPDSVQLGGEKRKLTIMMSDIRGFTVLSEHLEPEKVVQMLNSYFEVMVDVVLKYNGTINEIIGDSMLVLFGAPQPVPYHTERAIACAIEMQNAMAEVNRQNSMLGLPQIEMGIGLNECEVIVGNVGSKKRSKYGVVGSGVNMTDRIVSYSVGAQILISESVRKEVGEVIRIDRQLQVHPKGTEKPLTIYEVGGISGHYHLSLEATSYSLAILSREIPILYSVLEGKHSGEGKCTGALLRLSRTASEMRFPTALDCYTNLKFNLSGVTEELSRKDFYGKVVMVNCVGEENTYTVQFTSLPLAIDSYFQAAIDQGYKE